MKIATAADQRYKERRDELAGKLEPKTLWQIVDQWPLYCGIGNLARQLAIADILRSTLEVPGHIAEFGVWRGATTLLMAKMLRLLDPMGSKVVHAFDSFEGLTAFSPADGGAVGLQGSYRGSLAEMQAFIDLYELDDLIDIHVGLIEDSLPPLLRDRPELTFSMVYCDTDLFESTRTILDQLHPRLAKGGVIVFDEWNHPTYPGEGVAANEFLARFGDKYQVCHVPNTRQPSLLLRKIAY